MLWRLREGHGMTGWSEERWRELRAVYLGMCARVDHQLGLLRDALKRKGIYDDTALCLFSDHGDFTGDYDLVEKAQNLFYDNLTRVPFVLKPPRGFDVTPGTRDGLTELVDLVPTILDLAGIEPGYDHFGQSLVPGLADVDWKGRDAVFCEGGRLAHEEHCKESASKSAGNPQGLYYPRSHLQGTDDVAHGKAIMCRTADAKFVHRHQEDDEFYDLTIDTGETRNRISDPACAEKVSKLRERLLRHLVETADVVPYRIDARN
jgi:hypothetical protein